jgi:hypothetical protein
MVVTEHGTSSTSTVVAVTSIEKEYQVLNSDVVKHRLQSHGNEMFKRNNRARLDLM